MSVIKGIKEYFKGVGKIKFEGKSSKNPLSYRYYDKNKYVLGKPMKDHFKFAMLIGIFYNMGNDPFGTGTKYYPWPDSKDVKKEHMKNDAAFEFILN